MTSSTDAFQYAEKRKTRTTTWFPTQEDCHGLLTTPGPGEYLLPSTIGHRQHDPSRWRNPAFTLQGKWLDRIPNEEHETPGPCYDTRQVTRFGKMQIPGVIFSEGMTMNVATDSPGPAAYNIEPKEEFLTYKMPGFTIKGRHDHRSKIVPTPGPNQYKIPDSVGYRVPHLKNPPAFSIKSRPYIRKPHELPGPTHYKTVDLNLVKRNPPRAIIPKKTGGKKMVHETPGPTQYEVSHTNVLPRAPTFMFGIKRSRCSGTYRTAVDDALLH